MLYLDHNKLWGDVQVTEQGTIRVVELFAGVGGFRVGLERPGQPFQTVWANQWEPGQSGQWAYKCYTAHFQERSHCVNADIASVTGEVPAHDLLVGGFPCQDYSVASTGAKGIEGKKGVLWWSIRDIIHLRRPRFVLLENVDRLLRSPASQRGRDFGIILRCLYDEGYAAEWRVVNAADYGEAQRRRRTFLFAARTDGSFGVRLDHLAPKADAARWLGEEGFFAPLFPVETEPASPLTVADLKHYRSLAGLSARFSARFYNAGALAGGVVFSQERTPRTVPPKPLSALVEQGEVDERYFIPDAEMEKWGYMKGAKQISRRSRTGFEYTFSEGQIAFPDPLDRPARTMLTSEGTTNRSTHVIRDPHSGRLRKLTPLECERLNGFPDRWTDTGMPERQRYFIMGNALVVPLIQKMGGRLLELL